MSENLIDFVCNRFFCTKSGEILNLLYYLTPEGRHFHRVTYPLMCEGIERVIPDTNFSLSIPQKYQNIILQFTQNQSMFNEMSNDMIKKFTDYKSSLFDSTKRKKIKKHLADDLFLPSSDEENNNQQSSENDHEDSTEENAREMIIIEKPPEEVTPFDKINAITENELQHEEEDPDDSQFELDDDDFMIRNADYFTSPIENDGYVSALNTLTELIDRNGITEERKQALINFFVNWINGDPNTYTVNGNLLLHGCWYWIDVASVNISSDFSSFIFPYLSAASSERICERAFWYQQTTIGDQGMRMSPQTELNRINSLIKRK